MTLGLIFWIIMLLWLVFGFAVYSGKVVANYALWGNTFLLFVLFALLGWKVFGPAITG